MLDKRLSRAILAAFAVVLFPLALCAAWNLAWQGPSHKTVGLYGGIALMLAGPQLMIPLFAKWVRKGR